MTRSVVVRQAVAAAEAVVSINDATIGGGGFTSAGEVDQVVGEVALLVSRLPQVLRACAVWLAQEAAAGRVADDQGADPVSVTTEVVDLLAVATLAAGEAAFRLDRARQGTARLFSPVVSR